MEREGVGARLDGHARRTRSQAARPTASARIPAVLVLQRSIGNRQVARLLRPVVQRTELATSGGGVVASTDGPGRNQRAAVLGVQDRLHALWSIDNDAYGTERAVVNGKREGEEIKAAEIPRTIEAIDRNEGPHLAAPVALGVFKAALIAGVGAKEGNDGADVALMLELLHEEWHITNKEYDDARTVLAGVGTSVDPAAVPGFLAGLTKLKRSYAGGYPFRGTTATRTKPVIPDGPEQAAYSKAVEHHLAERKRMLDWLHEAAAQSKDILLRNSAQWCLSGRVKLYCLTRTHDSDPRAKAAGKPNFIALFAHPGGELFGGPSLYVRKTKGTPTYDNTDVRIEPDSGGYEVTGEIGVVEPSRAGKAEFFKTVKHEAQHDADHHAPGDEGSYKTELNARWIEGSFAQYSAAKRVHALGYTWNERQYKIFQDIWAYPALYPYLRKNWNQPNATARTAWRAMVVGYRKPDTFNPVNSLRIQNLNDAIAAVTWEICQEDDRRVDSGRPRDPKAVAVWTAMAALDETDRKAIKGNVELNRLALNNLSGRAHNEYFGLK